MANTLASDSLALVGSFIPPAVIMPYAGVTSPSGWVLCDGRAISRTIYAPLFAAISSAWGYGDNSTTFNIPDMRGRFPRGRDAGVARDADRATRTASNTGGNTGDNVGSVQTEATKKNGLANGTSSLSGTAAGQAFSVTSGNDSPDHTHAPDATGTTNFYTQPLAATGPKIGTGTGYISSVAVTQGASARHTHSVSGSCSSSSISGTSAAQTITGDAETRPINANVNYIIKI